MQKLETFRDLTRKLFLENPDLNLSQIINGISTFNRRKSALPKYDPPYAKRQMLKGYSHPNSPHPSQHLTPDHTFEDAGKLGGLVSGKLGGLGNFPPYRPVE